MDSNDDIPFTNKIDSNHTIYHVHNAETANPVNWYLRLPDNCAPYVIIYTGAQLSGSGAQLSGPGAQLSGPGARGAAVGNIGMHTYIRHICAPMHVQVLRSTLQNLRHYIILGGCDALVCCFSLQRAKEGRLLLNEVVGGHGYVD